METFLGKIAQFVLDEFHGKTGDVTIIFPNRRARVFLKNEFQKRITTDIWLPDILSLEEALCHWSGLRLLDALSIRFELLSIHHDLYPEDERLLSDFSGYAELFASDFDEIDQHLTDAESLFGVLTESKALELWHIDGTSLTESEKRFLTFYKSINQYYFALKNSLNTSKAGYQGHLTRYLAEAPDALFFANFPKGQLIFAGFNALTPAEEKIILRLVQAGRARLLWDVDTYYLENHGFELQEAGYFFRRYFQKHQSPQDLLWLENSWLTENKTIHCIGVPGNIGQCKIMGNQLLLGKTDATTALILADENLMLPAIHSIPEEAGKFNLTMGLPFSKSLIYRFINKVIDFHLREHNSLNQSTYRSWQMIPIFRHELIRLLAGREHQEKINLLINKLLHHSESQISYPQLEVFFNQIVEFKALFYSVFYPWMSVEQALLQLSAIVKSIQILIIDNEYLSDNHLVINQINAADKLLNRLSDLISDKNQLIDLQSLKLLINQLAPSYPIHFYGEPLSGMQVMGILESRNLDFDTVHMLSVNEGILPAERRNNSFIPFDIRQLYGLPTYQHKQAVFAYHFFRILQRAHTVYLYYNTESDGLGGGEKSRFIMQIVNELAKLNPKLSIKESIETFQTSQSSENQSITIVKTPDVLERLQSKAISGFSATLFSHYLSCPLRFVLEDLYSIREPEVAEEQIAANTFGNILHRAFENIYLNKKGKILNATDFQNTQFILLEAFRHETKATIPETGKNRLVFEVIQKVWNDFIENEIRCLTDGNELIIIDLEKEIRLESEVIIENKTIKWKLKGKIDRIDELNGQVRILDYKTGSVQASDLSLAEISLEQFGNKPKAMQLLIYRLLYEKNQNHPKVQSGIYALLRSNDPLMMLSNKVLDIPNDEVLQLLNEMVMEMFDHSINFEQTQNTKNCTYCPFIDLCAK